MNVVNYEMSLYKKAQLLIQIQSECLQVAVCSIFTNHTVYFVTTRSVIVSILLQRLNAFRHVHSIRNKNPLEHRFLFFFLIFKTRFWWNVPDQQIALKTDVLSKPLNMANEDDCFMKNFQLCFGEWILQKPWKETLF